MLSTRLLGSLFLCSLGSALGQTEKGLPSFEVASVKPSASMIGDGPFAALPARRGGPGTDDPGYIAFTNFPLKGLLVAAFGVMPYQIAGPAWLDSERFDINAKLPPGASRQQLGLMLQNLLADRFKMAYHRETKELPIFALVLAKTGPKLHAANGSAEPKCGRPVGERKPGERRAPGAREQVCQNLTMAAFAERLPKLSPADLDRLVVNATGLHGAYDFELAWTSTGIAPGSVAAGPTLFSALEKQLGLKLESRKAPVEAIIIDHIGRRPGED